MQIPRLSPKETEILRLLIAKGEMYGLELVAASADLKRGTVYVTLDRMAEKGYVESRQEQPSSTAGPLRRLFRATGHGMRVYNAWQTAHAAFQTGWAV